MKILHLFLISLFCILFPCKVSSKFSYQERMVDVLVIGGSTSGTSAGIASARLGIQTLIVEPTPWIGGMFTSQGVGACDGNHNLHSGIWQEFRQQLIAHYGSEEALSTGWVSNTLFEPHIGDRIFKAMARKEEKLEIIYNYYLVDIIKEGNRVKGALFENNKREQLKVTAKITIDATDIGESLKMAGADYRLGMDAKAETGEANAPEKANNIVQDLTWVAILKDYGAGADKTIEKPENYNPKNFRGSCKDSVNPKAVDCVQMLNYGKLPNNKYMINWPNKGNDIYLNVVEMSREDRNRELEKAKNYTLQFVYYIQTELGFNNLGLADDEFTTTDLLAYAPYHREGRRLKGLAYLTYNQAADPYTQEEQLYKTGISVGDYPVDHHHKQNPNAPDVGFPPVPSFNIPLGSLIPETVNGLIVSDKAISVSNLINGSTRLQPVVLLTGQAAGTLAALAVKENKQPREIPIRTVQATLLANNTYILPLFDVNPSDKDFVTLQKIAATGILKTTGEPYKWANRTWFYPDTTITVKEFTEGLATFNPNIKVNDSKATITEKQVLELIAEAGAKNVDLSKATDRNFSRREIAILLDKYLKPFEREIDFNGNYMVASSLNRPDFRNEYYLRKRSLHESISVKKGSIVMLGNSLTEQGMWSEYFPHKYILNRGIGGDKIEGITDRLPAIIKTKPDKIFIMGGINDLLFTNISMQQLKDEYALMLNTLKKQLPQTRIYIQSILPVNEIVGGDKRTFLKDKNEKITAFNVELKQLAASHGLVYIDLYAKVVNGGLLNRDLTYDGVHLNEKGYLLWTHLLTKYIGQ